MEIKVYNKLSVLKAVVDGTLPEKIIDVDEEKLALYITCHNVTALPGITITRN